MMHVHFALIAEGKSDGPLVGVLTALCLQFHSGTVDGVWAGPTLTMLETGKKLEDQLQALLDYDSSFNLLFVHRDADARDDSPARDTIARGVRTCGTDRRVVAVVPIQETEAWLLVDKGPVTQLSAWQKLVEDTKIALIELALRAPPD